MPDARTTAAGERVIVDKELFFDPIDAPGKSAYPIVYASWAVTDRKPSDPVRTPWIRAYLAFLLGDGQALLEQGPYGRLPDALVKRALAAIGKPPPIARLSATTPCSAAARRAGRS